MKNQTFSFVFVGVPKGSLGKKRRVKMQVVAENKEAAELKIYDKYEHIEALKLKG